MGDRRMFGRKKISTTVYLTPKQDRDLRRLRDETGVPVASYVRLGVDIVVALSRGLPHPAPGKIVARIERLLKRAGVTIPEAAE